VNKLFINSVKLLFWLTSRAPAQIAQKIGEEKKVWAGVLFFSRRSDCRLWLVKIAARSNIDAGRTNHFLAHRDFAFSLCECAIAKT
jgi:hypothetical protein